MSGAATKPFLAIIIFFAGGSLAFGQAGSTGGTIGKTDKSVLGGESTAEPHTPMKSRPKGQRPIDRRTSDQSPEVSVAGSWHWIADCNNGHWEGQFDLAETSRGQISGSFAGTSLHDLGTIEGHINGTSVTFTQKNAHVTQYWTGRLAAGRIKGTVSGASPCSWEATRK
jgi:hypothetical protein